jgi:hypothetical protein
VLAGQLVDRIGQREAGHEHDQGGDDHGVEVERRHEGRDQDRHRGGDHRADRVAGLAQPRTGAGGGLQPADHQSDDAGGGDVEPWHAQQAADPGGDQAESQHLHQVLAARQRAVQRAQRRVAFGQAHAPGDDVLGDAVDLAQPPEVVFARDGADHPGGVALAGRAHRIAEGQHHPRRIGPGLAFQAKAVRHLFDRGLEAGCRGAVGMEVLGQLDHEGDAGGVGFLGKRTGHARSMARAACAVFGILADDPTP